MILNSPHVFGTRFPLTFIIKKLGLKKINAYNSILVTESDRTKPIIRNFVHDLMIIGAKANEIIEQVKAKLTSAFSIVDIGPIIFYLGPKTKHNHLRKTFKLG